MKHTSHSLLRLCVRLTVFINYFYVNNTNIIVMMSFKRFCVHAYFLSYYGSRFLIKKTPNF